MVLLHMVELVEPQFFRLEFSSERRQSLSDSDRKGEERRGVAKRPGITTWHKPSMGVMLSHVLCYSDGGFVWFLKLQGTQGQPLIVCNHTPSLVVCFALCSLPSRHFKPAKQVMQAGTFTSRRTNGCDFLVCLCFKPFKWVC